MECDPGSSLNTVDASLVGKYILSYVAHRNTSCVFAAFKHYTFDYESKICAANSSLLSGMQASFEPAYLIAFSSRATNDIIAVNICPRHHDEISHANEDARFVDLVMARQPD